MYLEKLQMLLGIRFSKNQGKIKNEQSHYNVISPFADSIATIFVTQSGYNPETITCMERTG